MGGKMPTASRELIPVSHLNAYVYCSRRFFLEHNRGMFEDNVHTVEGRNAHRHVDGKDGRNALPERKTDIIHRHSVTLSSEVLGIIARLDLLEEKENGPVYPVEYKKGKKPPKNREPWLNDRVQLCAQALLMAENGLQMPATGYLYYIASRARVDVPLTPELIAETRRIIAECQLLSTTDIPPPLTENRNKCFGCSLNAICLPEEEEVAKGKKTNAKAILPASMDADILYVDTFGAYLSLSKGNIRVVSPDGVELGNAPVENLCEIVLCGPAQATTQTLHTCMFNDIPVHYLNTHGRYVGSVVSMLHYHGILREAQWKVHFDTEKSLDIAKVIVRSKIANMRTLMMRFLKEERTEDDRADFDAIKAMAGKAREAENLDSLRGFEGIAAKIYFNKFEKFIKPDKRTVFPFPHRNRRPPKDPVNALLGFGYSLLAKDCMGAAIRVGFDPFCGYYHSMKYGRPSLALDIMEFFRQPVVDSVVLSAINNGVFKEKDFYRFGNTCYLNEKGRKKFYANYEMRKKDRVTHPKFSYRMSYARTIELQYRYLGKYLLKEINDYEGFRIR